MFLSVASGHAQLILDSRHQRPLCFADDEEDAVRHCADHPN